jgi:hypothetical protein
MTITRFDFYFPGNHAVDAPMTLDGAPLFTRSEKNFYQISHELLEELYIELGREEIICRYCGWGFIPEVEDTDYCSRKCKVAAHRAEHSI